MKIQDAKNIASNMSNTITYYGGKVAKGLYVGIIKIAQVASSILSSIKQYSAQLWDFGSKHIICGCSALKDFTLANKQSLGIAGAAFTLGIIFMKLFATKEQEQSDKAVAK